jgi:hypothetical protein
VPWVRVLSAVAETEASTFGGALVYGGELERARAPFHLRVLRAANWRRGVNNDGSRCGEAVYTLTAARQGGAVFGKLRRTRVRSQGVRTEERPAMLGWVWRVCVGGRKVIYFV